MTTTDLEILGAKNQAAGVASFQKPILFDPADLDSERDKVAEMLGDESEADRVMPVITQAAERLAMKGYGAAISQIGAYFTRGNAEVNKWGFIFAVGLDAAEGQSMEDVAKQIGVTRAAISKSANEWVALLGLPRSRYMRSESAVEAYTERATTVHEAKDSDEADKSAIPAEIKKLTPKCKLTRTSLEMSEDATQDDYRTAIQALAQLNEGLQWWVGDWLVQAEKNYGSTYSGWVAGLGFNYQTLANWKTVSRLVTFSRRRENLTWQHHAEVAHLHHHQQDKWLAWASTADYLPPHAHPDDKPTIKPTRLLRESIRAESELKQMPSAVALPGDTIEQWCGLPMRSWKRNVFDRMLSTASRERLTRWANALRTPAEMYQVVLKHMEGKRG